MADELQRWKDAVAASVAAGKLKTGDIPGYMPPDPLPMIWIPDSRIGAGPGTSPIKSFQGTLMDRVRMLANNEPFRVAADASLVSDLLGQSANDAVAYLGAADPDCANRAALLVEYNALYWFAVTPLP